MIWYSYGRGGGGGCFFLPLMLLCGSFWMFDGFRGSWLISLLLVGVVWMTMSTLFRPRTPIEEVYDDEKPKRHLDEEKPKRRGDVIVGEDGELIEPDEDQLTY